MNTLHRAASKLRQTLQETKELGFLHPVNQVWVGAKDSQTKQTEMPGSHRIVTQIKGTPSTVSGNMHHLSLTRVNTGQRHTMTI